MEIVNKNIFTNRGAALNLTLVTKTGADFHVADTIVFSICKQGNMNDIIFQKTFTVSEQSNTFDIDFTAQEMEIGEPIKSGCVDYWYEIKMNGDTILIGYDKNGPKYLRLYPKAEESE